MTIGLFTIIKNEVEYIGYSIMSLLNHIDGFYYYDGNSTDGTIELIEYIKKKYDKDNKIHLFKNKDCKNLKTDYVKLFNEVLAEVKEEYSFFCHPDMICSNPAVIRKSVDGKYLRYSVKMESIAGEDRSLVITGRTTRWATIYKNTFGLHFYGWYGSFEEDFYFADITGDEHKSIMVSPPIYEIKETPIQMYHYCETKPYARRLGRMIKTLELNTPLNKEGVTELASSHPRVTLQTGSFMNTDTLTFNKFKGQHPSVFKQYNFNKFKKG